MGWVAAFRCGNTAWRVFSLSSPAFWAPVVAPVGCDRLAMVSLRIPLGGPSVPASSYDSPPRVCGREMGADYGVGFSRLRSVRSWWTFWHMRVIWCGAGAAPEGVRSCFTAGSRSAPLSNPSTLILTCLWLLESPRRAFDREPALVSHARRFVSRVSSK